MSPLWMRIFTLVGMALALASMQMKARAEAPAGPPLQQLQFAHSCTAATSPWRST
jgi:hypothetical protein